MARAAHGSKRNVLLIAQTELFLTYLEKFMDVFSTDSGLSFAAISPDELSRQPRCRRVDEATAKRSAWDLTVASWPSPLVNGTSILFPHGVFTAKVIPAPSGPHVHADFLYRDNRPVFTKVFATDFACRDALVARQPALAPTIAVVGDLRGDAMRAKAAKRALLRKEMGFMEDEVVVLIMSTWTESSLMRRHGRALLEAALALQSRGGCRFALTAHPLLWRQPAAHRSIFGELPSWAPFFEAQREKGIFVVPHAGDWEDALIAADVAVTDHTSLGVSFAMLGKPLVFIPLTEDCVGEDSVVRKLYAISPRLADVAKLGDCIRAALGSFPLKQIEGALASVIAHPSEAARRIRMETHSLLGLTPPH